MYICIYMQVDFISDKYWHEYVVQRKYMYVYIYVSTYSACINYKIYSIRQQLNLIRIPQNLSKIDFYFQVITSSSIVSVLFKRFYWIYSIF